VRAGATLVVGDLRRRARAVLAVHGGLLVPSVLGSAATDLRGAFGGHEGRALARGDVLSFGPAPPRPPPRIRLALPSTPPVTTVRVLPGPESFGPGGAPDALTGVTWTVRPESDRMGLRLHGAALPAPPADGASEPVVPGVVQLPPDGQPIVLLADSGTHGGYPRPNVVIGADLARLAGLRGGDRVDFRLVTEAAALAALRERERDLRVLRRALRYAYSRGES
jgi:antagonist of KipI